MSQVTLLEDVIEVTIPDPQPLELVLSMADTIRAVPFESQFMDAWLAWVQPALPQLWGAFVSALKGKHPWFSLTDPCPFLALSVVLLTDGDMQALNHQYRQKDSSTDVLTFSLLLEGQWQADTDLLSESDTEGSTPTIPSWKTLQSPGMPHDQPLELGEVYVSISWVLTHATPETQIGSPQAGQSLQAWRFYYLTERLIHGFLHLLGVHHDTLSDYNKVVAIQQQVLLDVFRHSPCPDS